jgi:GAF domain-containing protein
LDLFCCCCFFFEGAESTCLYVRVRKEEDDADKKKKKDTKAAKVNSQTEYEPAADGDYLYAMYYAVPQGSVGAGVEGGNVETGSGGDVGGRGSSSLSNTHAETSSTDSKTSSLVKRLTAGGSVGPEHLSEVVPLGKGITSRAILTREPWNIENVHAEPDFINEPGPGKPQNVRHMVVVPVLDANGNAIAVIQGMNKLRKPQKETSLFSKLVSGRDLEEQQQQQEAAATATTTSSSTSSSSNKGFTDHDVQILMALASHISVGLQQSMYRDPDEEAEVRLRDTIRILKEHGLAGITGNEDDDEEGAKAFTEKDRDQAAAASSHRRRRRLFPED